MDLGKGPLRSHAGMMALLRKVASEDGGMRKEARRYASGAVFELDQEVRQKAKLATESAAVAAAADNGGTAVEHVMLSYNWDHQEVTMRLSRGLNVALKTRGYEIWIDVEKMQGSTVEGVAVVCYGISAAYKESTNCRMEAQYAFQQQTDMVPLMMVDGYRPNGWLGILLGVRLWYGFYGSMLASEAAFEAR